MAVIHPQQKRDAPAGTLPKTFQVVLQPGGSKAGKLRDLTFDVINPLLRPRHKNGPKAKDGEPKSAVAPTGGGAAANVPGAGPQAAQAAAGAPVAKAGAPMPAVAPPGGGAEAGAPGAGPQAAHAAAGAPGAQAGAPKPEDPMGPAAMEVEAEEETIPPWGGAPFCKIANVPEHLRKLRMHMHRPQEAGGKRKRDSA